LKNPAPKKSAEELKGRGKKRSPAVPAIALPSNISRTYHTSNKYLIIAIKTKVPVDCQERFGQMKLVKVLLR
jgi:hypothetical protein